jgi:glucose-1-phosphate thymidylyltransferase
MKGILLAGGRGSRLADLTRVTNKHLLPVFDKPAIFYSLSLLMLAGVRNILVIVNASDLASFRSLLGDGERWGIRLSYEVQPEPRGIPEALLIGESHIGLESVMLVLGDNVIFGPGLGRSLSHINVLERATVFAIPVKSPERFAVVAIGPDGRPSAITEKPKNPPSQFAIPGVYFYPPGVTRLAAELQPSSRGELEISDLNSRFLQDGMLDVRRLPRGVAWFDIGSVDDLLDASLLVRSLEQRMGTKIACLEEVAFRMGFITSSDLESLIQTGISDSTQIYLSSILASGSPTLDEW